MSRMLSGENLSHHDLWPTLPASGPRALTFDTALVPKEQRFDAWMDVNSHTYLATLDPDDPTDFNVREQIWALGQLNMTLSEINGGRTTTVRTGKGRSSNPEALSIRVEHEGFTRGIVGDTPFQTQPGDVHLIDLNRPVTFKNSHLCYTHVYVPYQEIGFDPSRHGAQLILKRGTALADMLKSVIKTLSHTGAHTPVPDQHAVAHAFCGLMRSIIAGKASDPQSREAYEAARRDKVHQYIDRNLSDPRLSVERICNACGVSRATLYRDFSHLGGVRTHIRNKRLEMVKKDLEHLPGGRGVVLQTALRWGFHDSSQFGRAFRQAYGIAPSDMVGKRLPR